MTIYVSSPSRMAAIFGAVAGAAAMLVVMPFFYPLGRLIDPTVGGDEPIGLLTELVLGFIGGAVLSPFAGAIGAIVGWRIGVRRIGAPLAALLVGVAAAIAISVFWLLNGGRLDVDGSFADFWFACILGVASGVVSVVVFNIACARSLPMRWSMSS